MSASSTQSQILSEQVQAAIVEYRRLKYFNQILGGTLALTRILLGLVSGTSLEIRGRLISVQEGLATYRLQQLSLISSPVPDRELPPQSLKGKHQTIWKE